jgi:HlyD family secretion protein
VQDIAVQNADAAYTKAKASYDIQESQNKSDVEAAQRKLTFARLDETKYLEGDYDQLKKAAEEKIKLAQSELAKAKNTYDWSKNLAERKFLTKSELDRDELDFQRAQITLEQAQRSLDLLARFDDPRQREELKANREEAERGLERANLQAKSRLVDFEAARVTSKSKLELEQEKLQKYVDQIEKAKIRAKDSGMVVYTRSDGGMRGGGDPIQEGTQVRERQEILTIPRTNGLIVEASVHESVLKRVVVGNPCKIRVDMLTDREFDGVVQFVALLPDKNSWWANPNQRLYRSEISVTNPIPELRPGMSCSLEIVSERIPECLSVPLQAIVLDKGKPTAFVTRGNGWEQRDVGIGRSNDTKVEIVSGLSEGEEVLLAPPPGFTPQGAPSPAGGDQPSTVTTPDVAMPPGANPPGGEGMRGARDGATALDGSAPAPGTQGQNGPRGDRPRGKRGGANGGANGGNNRDGAAGGTKGDGTAGGASREGGGAEPAKPAESSPSGKPDGGRG